MINFSEYSCSAFKPIYIVHIDDDETLAYEGNEHEGLCYLHLSKGLLQGSKVEATYLIYKGVEYFTEYLPDFYR